MPGFWFTLAEVFPADEGWDDGVFLIGPPGEVSGGLSTGDQVVVPVTSGEHVTECLGFPLLNLGPDRLRWVRLHIPPLPPGETVRIGERVTRVMPEDWYVPIHDAAGIIDIVGLRAREDGQCALGR